MRYGDFAGRRASVIAFGTSDMGGKCPEGLARDMLDKYIEIGGNFIDTARVYGRWDRYEPGLAEGVLGRWMSDRRNRDGIVLSTKGGHHASPDDVYLMRLGPAQLRSDIEGSLESLQTDHVDIYWLHRDDLNRPVGQILETLNEFIEKGWTRVIGASNWTTPRLREAEEYAREHGIKGFYANQPRWGIAKQMIKSTPLLVPMDKEMYKMHMDTGMVCVPYSSQSRGFFVKLCEQGLDAVPYDTRRRFYFPENMAAYDRFLKVKEETGLSASALGMACMTCQPFPVFPLAGASRLEQVEALREAGDAVITPEQLRYINMVI